MSKTNFYSSMFVGFATILFLAYGLVRGEFVWSVSIAYSIILLIVCEYVAITTTINIENIVYIRTEEESTKTALPRVPFKVQKALKLIPVNLLILLTSGASAYYFLDEPAKSYWFIILIFPLIIHILGLIPYFLFKDTNLTESKKKILEDEDRHNVIVQIGKKLANKDSKSCRKTNTSQFQTILHYLKNGQNPDEVFEDRYTLLLPSSCCGDEKLVKLLIEHGSDVNFKSSAGMTALILACKHGFYDIASLLIKSGADKNIKDSDGKTALFYAQENKFTDIINMLSESERSTA